MSLNHSLGRIGISKDVEHLMETWKEKGRPIDILGKHDRRIQNIFGGNPGFGILFVLDSEKVSMELNSKVYHKASR